MFKTPYRYQASHHSVIVSPFPYGGATDYNTIMPLAISKSTPKDSFFPRTCVLTVTSFQLRPPCQSVVLTCCSTRASLSAYASLSRPRIATSGPTKRKRTEGRRPVFEILLSHCLPVESRRSFVRNVDSVERPSRFALPSAMILERTLDSSGLDGTVEIDVWRV